MLNGKKITVVLPAYNAELTLRRTVQEIDRTIVDDVIIVDEASNDGTIKEARALDLDIIRHDRNRGYGANQKTCYGEALKRGADIIIMLHPDYQYTPSLLTSMAGMIAYGTYDMVLASRILGRGALAGGMPVYKYVANRILTAWENIMIGLKLSEYHSGYRAYRREVLDTIRWDLNSDDFVFDNQIIAQAHYCGFRIGEISCPARYDNNSSSINFWRSVYYGFGVLKTSMEYRMQRCGLSRYSYFVPRGLRRNVEEGNNHYQV